jgi:hypothetical protein
VTDEQQASAPWYAVRCVFRAAENRPWGPTDLQPGASAYEERITVWRASSPHEAIARAEAEAKEYAETLGDTYVEFAQAYHLFDSPGDGAEVFSLIRDSPLEPGEYVDRFFDTGNERQRDPGDTRS